MKIFTTGSTWRILNAYICRARDLKNEYENVHVNIMTTEKKSCRTCSRKYVVEEQRKKDERKKKEKKERVSKKNIK